MLIARPARRRTRSLRLAAALLCLGPAMVADRQPAAAAEAIEVRSQTVALDTGRPERTHVGRLAFRGGLSLSSPDSRWGGLSDLRVSANGARFVAISDAGWRLSGRLDYDPAGWLAGVDEVDIEPLRGPGDRPLSGKAQQDAEALVVQPDGAEIVAFEQQHKLLLYPADGSRPRQLATPRGIEQAPLNGGIEALTRLADGRLLALSEGLRTDGWTVGWIGDGRRWSQVNWRSDAGFRPTAAATLFSGDVLVLERMFPPPAARVRLIAAAGLNGERLDGVEIARFEGPLTFDNMEGIDAVQNAAGETLVFLLSDDNYSPIQQTLLMLFRLEP